MPAGSSATAILVFARRSGGQDLIQAKEVIVMLGLCLRRYFYLHYITTSYLKVHVNWQVGSARVTDADLARDEGGPRAKVNAILMHTQGTLLYSPTLPVAFDQRPLITSCIH